MTTASSSDAPDEPIEQAWLTLPPHERLGLYTQSFNSAELNSSFYRWPRNGAFASWRRRLPPGFRFSVKAPRGLTHAKQLYAPEQWVLRIAAGWHELGDKRAVLLVQLGPNQERDDARLEYFLNLLPDWISTAVELRHWSWVHDDVLALLERHGAAYCVMSGVNPPCVLRDRAAGLRPPARARPRPPLRRLVLRRRPELVGGPDARVGGRWPGVFAYFNNDGGGNAVRNAQTLRQLLHR